MNFRGVIAAGQPEYDLRRSEERHWAIYPDHELHIFGGLTTIFYKAQGQLEHGRVDRLVINQIAAVWFGAIG